MPELPEVEAARRAVADHCTGKKIKRAVVAEDAKVIDGVSASDFQTALVGKTVVDAHRRGKNMWLQLDSPPFPSFQFGMAGAIYIKGVAVTKYKRSAVNDTDEWPSKYSKLFIELEDGMEVSFTDKRRFAKVRLLEDPPSVPPISELGPDALLEPMTVDEFISSLSKKKTAIKALLLDQSYVAGIGNWIADEVLYQAKIHPLQIASSLSEDSCLALHKCIEEVIEKAIEVGADSSQYPNNWIFHSREKKSDKAFVDGKKIEFINAGGRTTAYVPELQKLGGAKPAKALGKSRKLTSKKERDEDNEDAGVEDQGDDEEEDAPRFKSKRGSNTTRGSNKPPAKRKPKNSDGKDDGKDDNDEKDNQEKITKKVTKTKKSKVEKRSKKNEETSKRGKQMKKGVT